ncbi:MAG: hypothetical protein IPO98_17385 [Saprospiraceae bacterium]|nr:hypothetical protein [Saprospiraceae bacterium]
MDINEWIKGLTEMDKDEQKNFFEYGLYFFRQFIFRMLSKSKDVNLTHKELEVASRMEKIINISKAEIIVNLLNDAIENINRNINLKILMFSDTLAIGEVLRTNHVRD